MINLTQSRSDCYTEKFRCYWIPRDRSGKSDNEALKHLKRKDGKGYERVLFFAAEVDERALGANDIEGAFQVPYVTKAIQTTDRIDGMQENDWVECDGERWIVERIRSIRIKSVSPYIENRRTIIGLRK